MEYMHTHTKLSKAARAHKYMATYTECKRRTPWQRQRPNSVYIGGADVNAHGVMNEMGLQRAGAQVRRICDVRKSGKQFVRSSERGFADVLSESLKSEDRTACYSGPARPEKEEMRSLKSREANRARI